MTAPSRAAVKCKLCKKQFCNKAYFLKHHFDKEHNRSKLEAETQWEFVLKRAAVSKWEEKAFPNSAKQINPFTMARTVSIKLKTPIKTEAIPSSADESTIKLERKSEEKVNITPLKRKRSDEGGQEYERKIKRSRVTMLEAENERLKRENEFLKKEREENSAKESMTLKSLLSLQENSRTITLELKAAVKDLKEHHKCQKEEVTQMQNTTRRDWILRKSEDGDERRFCLPCLKWHQAPGQNLGNLAKSPFVNGGVSVREMKEKAIKKREKPSQLWNQAYRDHESKPGHKKSINLQQVQGTLTKYIREPAENAMKNRLRIAYHTTKRVQSETYYEHSTLLAKELNVMVGSTQLGREACAEMRKTFSDGILKKQREFFAKPDKHTKALKLVSLGADEVTRHNRQFSIDTITALDDDNML